MAKRKMSAAAEGLFQERTGAEALAEMTGMPLTEGGATGAASNGMGDEEKFTTSFTIQVKHRKALKRAALERSLATGGQADASEILREVLDDWLAAGS